MVVNEDHYINRVLHEAGEYELTVQKFDTPYVFVAVRILVDPADPADIASVNALQDQFRLVAGSAKPFVSPDYDPASMDATREALLERGRAIKSFAHAFGRKDEVDPELHLIATAGGWGGLPEKEAHYENVDLGLPVGEYRLTVRDVAFESVDPVGQLHPVHNGNDLHRPVCLVRLSFERDQDRPSSRSLPAGCSTPLRPAAGISAQFISPGTTSAATS